MSFAKKLSEKALTLSVDTVPAEAVHIARRAIIDTIGVALAGRSASYLGALESVLDVASAPGEATLWGAEAEKLRFCMRR
ncbi:MmgE/PrpD family protein [Martelella soudanensis]|uniref:MmgE/PrpD family protein n=1 Tax=Martelella sp. NC18 TaxID=2740297 RepID=UPI001AEDD1BB